MSFADVAVKGERGSSPDRGTASTDMPEAENNPASLIQIGNASLRGDWSLRRWSEFEHVKKNGSRLADADMILVHCISPDGKLKIGIICGKKFDRRAVKRNRARRVVRESFRLIRNGIKESHLLIIPKKRLMGTPSAEVQRELIKLLSKAGLWKDKQAI